MKRTMIAILLAAVMLSAFAACGNGPATEPTTGETPAPVSFTLVVTLPDGTQNTHELTSAKATLGEALRDEGLAAFDDKGYITAVEGIEASWDADQAYWSLEIDGAYATHGANDELLAAGKSYELIYIKG